MKVSSIKQAQISKITSITRKVIHTDEISNIESMVVGPESVVDARIPTTVGAYNMIGGGDGGCSGGDKEEINDKA